MINNKYLYNKNHDIISNLESFSKIMNMEKKKILYLVLDNMTAKNLHEFTISSGHFIYNLASYKDFWIRYSIMHKLHKSIPVKTITNRKLFNTYYNLNKYSDLMNNKYNLTSLHNVLLYGESINRTRECNNYLNSMFSIKNTITDNDISTILYTQLDYKLISGNINVFVLYNSLLSIFTKKTDKYIKNFECYQEFCIAKIKGTFIPDYNNPVNVFNNFSKTDFYIIGI